MATQKELLNKKLDYLLNTKALIKQTIEYKGVSILDNNTFREYAEKIYNIKSGNIIVYQSEEDLHNATNIDEGTYGIVYRTTTQDIDEVDSFRYISFPDTVVTTDIIEDTYRVFIKNMDDEVVGRTRLDSNSFYFTLTIDGEDF